MPKIDIWSSLTPQSQAAVEKSRELYASLVIEPGAATDALSVARAGYNHERRYWNAVPVALPSVQELALQTEHGRVPLRLYKPTEDQSLPVVLYAHGGGYMLGNLDTHDRICRLLAQKSGWAVLAVDYTLAPEKKFPVQSEQVFAALEYVASHASELGLDVQRIAVAGDSAGAHLSLGTSLRARAAGNQPAIRAQLLYYGGFGLKDSASKRMYGWADLDGLGDEDAKVYTSHYMAKPEDRDDPRANLLASDMAGLPPTFIGAVAYDPLRDDSLALAEFCKERSVPYTFKLYEGVLHSFLHYSRLEPIAMQAIEDGAAFLRDVA